MSPAHQLGRPHGLPSLIPTCVQLPPDVNAELLILLDASEERKPTERRNRPQRRIANEEWPQFLKLRITDTQFRLWVARHPIAAAQRRVSSQATRGRPPGTRASAHLKRPLFRLLVVSENLSQPLHPALNGQESTFLDSQISQCPAPIARLPRWMQVWCARDTR